MTYPFGSHSSHLTDHERDIPKPITRAELREMATVASVYFVEVDGLIKIATTIRKPSVAKSRDAQLLAVIHNAGQIRLDQIAGMFRASRVGRGLYERTPELDALIRAFAV